MNSEQVNLLVEEMARTARLEARTVFYEEMSILLNAMGALKPLILEAYRALVKGVPEAEVSQQFENECKKLFSDFGGMNAN